MRGGTLARPAVDLAATPPPIVFDALHAGLLKEATGLGAARAVAELLVRRALGRLRALVPVGTRGPKFGAALP